MSSTNAQNRQTRGEVEGGLLIRDLPIDERPRDRLLQHGGQALSDAEIVSILLNSGRPGLSAVGLARELLRDRGGLRGLIGAASPLLRGPGLGPGKASVLLAAIELAARLTRSELPERHPLREPSAVARYLYLRYGTGDQEIMGTLYLDTRHRLLEEAELFRGTLDRAAVEPRTILKRALLIDSPNLVVFHTHPSGDPAPSAEDLAFTRRLSEAAEIVGVRLLDHLILGSPRRWLSLKEYGAS